MPTRASPPLTAAQQLIHDLTGYSPPTETREQTAAQELIAELFGIDVPNAAERGEDFFTAHEIRRRPADMPYSPIPPNPGPFGQFPEMEWVQMDSSNVDRAAFDPQTGDIFVQFLSGAIYVYYRQGQNRWDDFLASNSKGMFVWYVLRQNGTDPPGSYQNIRSGQHIRARGTEREENRVTPIFTSAERRAGRR